MEQLKSKAIRLGATDLKKSNRKNKKYMVLYKKKWIHFGDSRYEDFLQHKDEDRRKNFKIRMSKIMLKNGIPAINVKSQPAFWSYNVTW